jgi:hypothetical protein
MLLLERPSYDDLCCKTSLHGSRCTSLKPLRFLTILSSRYADADDFTAGARERGRGRERGSD